MDDRSSSPPQQTADAIRDNRWRLVVCFLVPCLTAWLVATVWVPLQLHQAEEYYSLAQATGEPSSLLRPPGYVAFLRLVIAIASPAFASIYAAQAALLGLAAAAFFQVARRWLEPPAACVLALAFGCHPLVVLLVGYVHYDLLHLVLLVLTVCCIVNGFGSARISWPWIVVAGLAAGLTTLSRPMTLLYPLVLAVTLAWLERGPRGRFLPGWLAFSAAMGLTIAPHLISNFERTGRVIPINAQTGAAFWPMTLTALHPTSDNFPWTAAWWPAGDALVRSHLPPPYPREVFMTQTLAMDDLFKAEAWRLFRAHPAIYFENVADNLLFFWTGDSRRFLRAFQFYQFADRPSRIAPRVIGYFIFLSAVVHLLAAGGAVLAFWRRERALVLAGSVFLTLWLVHGIVYLDARYLYAGLPFFLWFAGYGLRELLPKHWPRDLAAASALAALSCLGCFLLLV